MVLLEKDLARKKAKSIEMFGEVVKFNIGGKQLTRTTYLGSLLSVADIVIAIYTFIVYLF